LGSDGLCVTDHGGGNVSAKSLEILCNIKELQFVGRKDTTKAGWGGLVRDVVPPWAQKLFHCVKLSFSKLQITYCD